MMILRLLQERLRARAIDRLGLIERPAEPGLDRFVEQAAAAFAAPIAFLTLIRHDRLWVKASHGLAMTCIPRGDSFCTLVLDGGDTLEICDALLDARVRTLPAVMGEPRVRYYMGAPLTLADGPHIGALCVLDTARRPAASVDQRAYLNGLARQAAGALEGHARIGGGMAA